MKLISNQINPHFTIKDALYAAFQVRFLGSKKNIDFSDLFGTNNYQLLNASRSALELIIDIVQPPKTKKIALPAFICAVVAVPFVSRGYEIEWIDTDENGCIDVDDFARKSDNVSMLVVPHIFGQMIDLEPFAKICRAQHIFLIEDGAHGWSDDFVADVKIMSFGREKVVSCVSGGGLVWSDISNYASDFKKISLQEPNVSWIVKHALQPLLYSLAMNWWQLGGKIIPMVAQKLKLLPKAVHPAEKKGRSTVQPARLPTVQQRVLAYQLQRHEKIVFHQQNIAAIWRTALAPIFSLEDIIIPSSGFRVIIKTPQAKKIRSELWKACIHLTEWDGVPIAPSGTDLVAFGYERGDCPRAELFSQNYITLPTNRHISKKDVKKVVKVIKHCIK